MANPNDPEVHEFIGSVDDDAIVEGYVNEGEETLREEIDQVDKVNGHAGDDQISTGAGNDLAAGDMVGNEWTFVDGKWVYDPSAVVVSDLGETRSYDDDIQRAA